ncbi:MAG TPA: hypothetical protein DIS90_15340 [Cytophagales bacterium]|nr:hypothetical protein [Cytophagales bacterium]
MTLLPEHYETIVLTKPALEILGKVSSVTSSKLLLQNREAPHYLFSGWIKGDHFRIAIKINRPNNYIPLVIGRVESTSSGCIVLVKYKLFPVTKMFLIFWSFFIVMIGIFTSYQYQSIIYFLFSAILLGVVHWVTWSNFKIQLKVTRQTLLEVIA